MMVCCLALGVSLTSCGDDEPVITGKITKTDLTAPMCLFKAPATGVVSVINGFDFWTFTDSRAASGRIYTKDGKPYIQCFTMSDTWNLTDGRLAVGAENFILVMAAYGNAKAFALNNNVYVASNLTVSGYNLENALVELGFSKDRLWRVLDKCKETGNGVFLQDVE